ncbi:hypothetical protein ColKHC_14232 [Colletotrichum higginsianum]|nr:hypothetical protein ColKHC_14232 [Colletotrichum higginsianum]
MESHYTLPRRDFDTDQVYFDTLLEYGMAIQNCELQLRHAFNSHCHAVNDAPLSDLSDLTSLPSRASRLPQHLVLAKAKQLAPIFFEYEAEQAAQARQQHTHASRPDSAAMEEAASVSVFFADPSAGPGPTIFDPFRVEHLQSIPPVDNNSPSALRASSSDPFP